MYGPPIQKPESAFALLFTRDVTPTLNRQISAFKLAFLNRVSMANKGVLGSPRGALISVPVREDGA